MSSRSGGQATREKKKRRVKATNDDESSSEEEEVNRRLPYFVPEAEIDVEPLAMYVRGLLDNAAPINIGTHPKKETLRGYHVYSCVSISLEDIQAIIEDTRSWKLEMRLKNRKMHYSDSDAWTKRRSKGRAEQGAPRPMAQMKRSDGQVPTQNLGRNTSQTSHSYAPENLPFSQPSVEQPLVSGYAGQRLPQHSMQSPRPAVVSPLTMENITGGRSAALYEAPEPIVRQITQTTQYTEMERPQASNFSQPANVRIQRQSSLPPPTYDQVKAIDNPNGGGGSGGGGQPDTTGSHGFSNLPKPVGMTGRPSQQQQQQQQSQQSQQQSHRYRQR